ncbi:MAG: ECF-type sigma factor [Planctomycetota bacterium]|jgi:RNA polymerase sigma factor (TIGR02999 family)
MGGAGQSDQVTRLLSAAAAGDARSADDLLPLVYAQLRAIAQRRMGRERADHTLQATALVHEAYARLVGGGDPGWAGRGHFYVAAGEAMRRILIEHARGRGRVKRGGGRGRKVPLDVLDLATAEDSSEIMDLDAAFRRMQEEAPQMADVVRLRFYAGLDIERTARALNISPTTAKRRWTWARTWLYRELRDRTNEHEHRAAAARAQP